MEVVFEDAYILICDKPLGSKRDLVEQTKWPISSCGGQSTRLRQTAYAHVAGIALLTGCNAFTEDFNVPLADVQISRLGQPQKVTIGKSSTDIEGRAKCGQLSFELDDCIHSDSPRSPASSSQAQIARGLREVLPSRQLSGSIQSL
jgi:chaperonin GroEL (HSP60 family)